MNEFESFNQSSSRRQESAKSPSIFADARADQSSMTIFKPRKIPTDYLNQMAEDRKTQESSSFTECTIALTNNSIDTFPEQINRRVNLKQDEVEELLAFLDEIESNRQRERQEKQIKRSNLLADKLSKHQQGAAFFGANNISPLVSVDGENNWMHTVRITREHGQIEEITQQLNFYTPQHSWLLENWLSEQAVSWTVRRLNETNGRVMFQVSFGFQNQTSLDAEASSREAAIIAIAEDLLS